MIIFPGNKPEVEFDLVLSEYQANFNGEKRTFIPLLCVYFVRLLYLDFKLTAENVAVESSWTKQNFMVIILKKMDIFFLEWKLLDF